MGALLLRGQRGIVPRAVCWIIAGRVFRLGRFTPGWNKAAVFLSLRGVQLAACAASVHRFVRVFVRSHVHLRRDLRRMWCSVRTNYTQCICAARARQD